MNEFRKLTPEEEQQYKRRKVILSFMGICSVILIVLVVLLFMLQAKEARTFKLFFNDEPVTQMANLETFLIEEDGEYYVAAESLTTHLLGYRYQRGTYGSFGQSNNGAYIQNNYEVAAFTIGSNELKKYITPAAGIQYNILSDAGYCETTTLELPIIEKNGIVYIPLKHLNDICNASWSFSNNNTLHIYDINKLIEIASQNAAAYGYTSISGEYENLRALSY